MQDGNCSYRSSSPCRTKATTLSTPLPWSVTLHTFTLLLFEDVRYVIWSSGFVAKAKALSFTLVVSAAGYR